MRPVDLRSYKQELRQACRARRTGLDPADKAQRDSRIAENVRRLYQYAPSETLLVYMSTAIEVDTHRIITNAWADGKRVAVPRCITATRQMQFHYITSFDEVSPGVFSVLEPAETAPAVTDFSNCLMLVPAMLFDWNGYRLGYGKGYYDRFMARFTGASAGLCYSDELKKRMYHGHFDRAVDVIVTDRWIRTCRKKRSEPAPAADPERQVNGCSRSIPTGR